MNFYIQQTIHINLLKVQSIANSSMLQIGSSGIINASSNLFNTGGFTGPAPKAKKLEETLVPAEMPEPPFIPLAPPGH